VDQALESSQQTLPLETTYEIAQLGSHIPLLLSNISEKNIYSGYKNIYLKLVWRIIIL